MYEACLSSFKQNNLQSFGSNAGTYPDDHHLKHLSNQKVPVAHAAVQACGRQLVVRDKTWFFNVPFSGCEIGNMLSDSSSESLGGAHCECTQAGLRCVTLYCSITGSRQHNVNKPHCGCIKRDIRHYAHPHIQSS